MPAIRLLPFECADGPTNMAADEALLESAERGAASLRFYTWSEPTLSLGYFQPAAVAALGLPWVRRSTGGDAIVHHHELTYCLALPDTKGWRHSEPWTCRFHHFVQDVLASVGVESRPVLCGEEQRLGEVLCFLHQTAGDLLIRGSKVTGSAQRKRHGALLQHGSILLDRSEHAPVLAGINDLRGGELPACGSEEQQVGNLPSREVWPQVSDLRVSSDAAAFAKVRQVGNLPPRWLAERLAEKFEAQPGEWTALERERIAAIRAEKYANPEWNRKR